MGLTLKTIGLNPRSFGRLFDQPIRNQDVQVVGADSHKAGLGTTLLVACEIGAYPVGYRLDTKPVRWLLDLPSSNKNIQVIGSGIV
jgi:hypothetical protein